MSYRSVRKRSRKNCSDIFNSTLFGNGEQECDDYQNVDSGCFEVNAAEDAREE